MSFKFQVDFQLRISFPNTAQDECGVGVSGSSQAKPLKASFCRVVTQAGMCWISRWKNWQYIGDDGDIILIQVRETDQFQGNRDHELHVHVTAMITVTVTHCVIDIVRSSNLV